MPQIMPSRPIAPPRSSPEARRDVVALTKPPIGLDPRSARRFTVRVGNSRKWAAPALAVMAVVGYGISAMDDSCVETQYSGGRLIECESTAIFQPVHEGGGARSEDASRAGMASIPVPPRVMGFFGAVLHRGCETTKVPEGYWTVCEDGFSLLERGHGPVAWVFGRNKDEDAVAKAERKAAAARDDIDRPVEDSDCGPFPCSDYVRKDDDPKRAAYLITLSDYEIARLGAMIRAWEDQEVARDLQQARAQNTALHARLKEIAAHEADIERAHGVAANEPATAETVASIER